jgi:hypothetical protein
LSTFFFSYLSGQYNKSLCKTPLEVYDLCQPKRNKKGEFMFTERTQFFTELHSLLYDLHIQDRNKKGECTCMDFRFNPI